MWLKIENLFFKNNNIKLIITLTKWQVIKEIKV